MNDEYLWDKTGDDPGIRSLENALSEFRMRSGPAPVIPPAVATVADEPKRRGFFRLGFAFGAVAAIVAAVALIGWIGVRDQNVTGIKPPPARAEDPSVATIVTPPDVSEPRTEAAPRPRPRKTGPRVIKTVYFKRAKADPKRDQKLDDRPLLDESQLTAEERQAFEKLMLALSITSSKLKIVKDKLNGGGE